MKLLIIGFLISQNTVQSFPPFTNFLLNSLLPQPAAYKPSDLTAIEPPQKLQIQKPDRWRNSPPLPRLRSPKFLISDVTAYKVNNPTNPIKQALSNIRDFKQSLLRGIFPQKAQADTEPVGVWLVQDAGISQGITGASSYHDKPPTQTGFLHFRPSLTDPLRPGVKLMSSSYNLNPESDKFSSPSEFTPIDSAVIGQQAQYSAPIGQYSPGQGFDKKPSSVESLSGQSSPLRLSGRLKVPKETTPIDVAVFRMPYEEKAQKTSQLMEEESFFKKPGHAKLGEVVFKKSKLRLQNPLSSAKAITKDNSDLIGPDGSRDLNTGLSLVLRPCRGEAGTSH